MTRPALLAFTEVELPARRVAFEVLVIELGRVAQGLYALGQYLHAEGEHTGYATATLLSEAVERRCDGLRLLMTARPEGGERADG